VKELKEAFRLYDKEGNGFIPTSCLKEILKELDDQLSDADLNGMIQEIDSDGSGMNFELSRLNGKELMKFSFTGTVDFDEFMEMMTGE
jgi:calmodulin